MDLVDILSGKGEVMKKQAEKYIDALISEGGIHEEIEDLRDHNAALLATLRLCLPVMAAHTRASHLTDGFRPKRNENDRILARVKRAIEGATGGGDNAKNN
jgi:hypothetical protein